MIEKIFNSYWRQISGGHETFPSSQEILTSWWCKKERQCIAKVIGIQNRPISRQTFRLAKAGKAQVEFITLIRAAFHLGEHSFIHSNGSPEHLIECSHH